MQIFPDGYKLSDNVFYPLDYVANFTYSDGENFEQQVYTIIKNATDKSVFSPEMSNAFWNWESQCHFSPLRTNILRPLDDFLADKKVLELGAGFGVITRHLASVAREVLALEASSFRAQTTQLRTEDLSNVTTVCARIEEFEVKEKFDVVTLIGVLQYARKFTDLKENAEKVLLQKAAQQLSKEGVMIIAIQNKLGLKYFGGYPEPNIGVPFFGLENQYQEDGIVRFSLAELKALLSEVGLSHHHLLIPLPDYHMPVSILNPQLIAKYKDFKAEDILALAASREKLRPDWRAAPFSMEKVWQTIHKAGLTESMANSFLLISGKSPDAITKVQKSLDSLCYHYSVERKPEFVTEKRFINQNNKLLTLRKKLTNAKNTLPITFDISPEDYITGRLYWLKLLDIINVPSWTLKDVANWALPWINLILDRANVDKNNIDIDANISGSLFDSTPLNCVQDAQNQLHFIDNEWQLHQQLPLSFVLIRGIFNSFLKISNCQKPNENQTLSIKEIVFEILLLNNIEVTEEHFKIFIKYELDVQSMVANRNLIINEEFLDKEYKNLCALNLLTRELAEHSTKENVSLLRRKMTKIRAVVSRAVEIFR